MFIPRILEPVVQYYTIYGPALVLVTLILAITYTFISNFAAVRSAYMCTSLKNVLNGNVGKCFGSRIGSTCSKSDIGYTHGWCNDTENYGPLRGTRAGPYAVKCNDWIWNKSECPPDTCGKISGGEWGWCADKGVQRAMRGQACGPFQGSCDTWVWNAKACPQQCGTASCTDDSCICSMLKARYVILKRVDNKAISIAVNAIEVYDSDGYRIKSDVRPTLWPQFGDISTYGPQNISKGTGISKTEASKDAYIQLDLGEDKAIGRVIIKNVSSAVSNRIVGTALILRKNDNKTALYRKLTNVKSVYDIPVGKAKPVIPEIKVKVKDAKDEVKDAKDEVKEAEVKAKPQAQTTYAACPVGYSGPDAAGKCVTGWSKACEQKCAEAKCSSAKGKWIPLDYKKNPYTCQMPVKINVPAPGSLTAASPAPAKPSPWKQITGMLKHISADPSWTWGVNSKNEIYKCKTPCSTGAWSKVEGSLVQVDVGKDEVWGVNSSNDIYRRPKDGSGKWTNVKGKLKYVSAGPTGAVWGVNSSNNIYRCSNGSKCDGNWKQVPGSLTQLSVGPREVWGVNAKNEIYKGAVDGTGSWTKVPGVLKHVAVGDNEVVGVNTLDDIYTCKQPCTGNWSKIDGKLKQIDTANSGNTVGVNDKDNIYGRI